MSVEAYVFAIAFQLAGAVLLIIKYWLVSEKDQLSQLQNRRTHDKGKGNIVFGDGIPSNPEFIEELWLSRIAFVYIAVGYVAGIWGDISNARKSMVAVKVFALAVILVFIGKWISYKKSKRYKNNEIIVVSADESE